MRSRSSDVGSKQTEKLEADDVSSRDQRVWHRQLSPQLSTFDRKLRLEMGRDEATSLGSKFGFFRRGQIIAFLQQCGNVIWSNDALQMAAMTGLMISLDCLISHVGRGSNRHCFHAYIRARKGHYECSLWHILVKTLMLTNKCIAWTV